MKCERMRASTIAIRSGEDQAWLQGGVIIPSSVRGRDGKQRANLRLPLKDARARCVALYTGAWGLWRARAAAYYGNTMLVVGQWPKPVGAECRAPRR